MNTSTKQGIIFAVCAYILWGIAPIYFKQITAVPAPEILAHRIVWSVAVLGILIGLLKRTNSLVDTLKSRKRILILILSSLLLAINWLIFIWAVNAGLIMEASLGYYINPLLNVLLGRVVLSERLRPMQMLAVGLVIAGVAILLIGFGSFPWIALSLALSFSIYGLLRKMVSAGPLEGLTIETAIMLPVALGYLLVFSTHSNFTANPMQLNLLLIAAGLVTTVPLLFFNGAAKRLKYSTVGFLQYIGPTLMFIVAVTVYDEPVTLERMTMFAFVWAGVVLFCFDSIASYRHQRNQAQTS